MTQLVTLAADVRGVLGDDTIITYAADWTEYGAHVVGAMAQEVRFRSFLPNDRIKENLRAIDEAAARRGVDGAG